MGLGDLPRVPRRARRARTFGDRRRHAGRPRRGAGLRRWASGARATSRPPPTTSRPWPPSCGRRSRPARSASRRRAPSATGPWTASRCPAPSPPRTSCSALGRAMAAGGRARVRAGARRRRRRGPRRARAGGRLDVPAGRRDRHARCRSRLLQVDAAPDPVARADGRVAARPRRPARRSFPRWRPRPFGMLIGFQTHHAFSERPTYRDLARPARPRGPGSPSWPGRGPGADPGRGPTCRPTRRCCFDGMNRHDAGLARPPLRARATRPTTSRRPTAPSPRWPRPPGVDPLDRCSTT